MPGPIPTFIASFCISALAGIAYALTPKKGKPFPPFVVLVWSGLNAGLLGLCCALILWPYFSGTEEGVYRLIGLAGLTGLGGVTAQAVIKMMTDFFKVNSDAKPTIGPGSPATPDSDLIL